MTYLRRAAGDLPSLGVLGRAGAVRDRVRARQPHPADEPLRGRRAARRAPAPDARTTGADPERGAAHAARVPDDLGDAARHRARTELRCGRGRARHGDRDRRGLHVRGGRAEDVRGAAHRTRRDGRVGSALVPDTVPAVARADARVHRSRQRRAAGQGTPAGPVRHRGGDPHDGRRRRTGGGDRDRGTRADPLDLRLRRHGRARGDGAAPRHGRGRRRRDRRRGDPRRDRGGQVAVARVQRDAPTTSSVWCS